MPKKKKKFIKKKENDYSPGELANLGIFEDDELDDEHDEAESWRDYG
ncbi:MAG: hypothetical protein ACOC80_12495 [Petrotogales bacterium]